MKTFLINVLIITAIFIAYWVDVFDLFTSKYALVFSFTLVIISLLLALKVFGNPFSRTKDDDNDK